MGLQPTQAPPRCTKCNSQPISGQCTNFVFVLAVLHANMQGYQFFWKTWTSRNSKVVRETSWKMYEVGDKSGKIIPNNLFNAFVTLHFSIID